MTDFRYALRQVLRAPGFALVAILSLALGIGANTAVFSLANALLFQPITALRPDEVVRVYRGRHSPLAWDEFVRVRALGGPLAQVGGERSLRVGRTDTAVPEALTASLVVGDYFAVLGARPAAGRLLSAADTTAAMANTVVLAHEYWRRAFAGDPAAVGGTMRVNGQAYTIVGVAPEGFAGSLAVWRPMLFFPAAAVTPLQGIRFHEWGGSIYTFARLRPNAGMRHADAALATLGARMVAEDSARWGREPGRPVLHVGTSRGLPAEIRGPTAMGAGFLLGLVGLVLLIACGNVANLLLARATVRARELGVRAALGARRSRLVRQLLAESAVLAVAGGVLAVGMSALVARRIGAWIVANAPEPIGFDPGLDGRVLGYTAAMCALAVVAFGLVPAVRASRPDLASALRDGARGTDRRGNRLRTLLVGGQVALCTIVLATAALFARSLANSRHADPGFAVAGLVDLHVAVETRRLAPPAERALLEQLVERARRLPGVERATLARAVPLGGTRMERGYVAEPTRGDAAMRITDFNVVGEEYFATLGIPIVRGREFGAAERAGTGTGIIVNETLAARSWPGENPIGRRLSVEGDRGPWLTVVGVAKDVRYNTLGEEPTPMLYLPWGQHGSGDMVVHARTAPGRADAVAAELARLARAVDPLLPPVLSRPMARDMAASLVMAQVGAAMLGGFGLLAVLLASVGIYGITAYAVAQRTREIGIRIALGAAREDVVRLVARTTARPVLAGLATGLVFATGVSFALRSQLYGVGAGDPPALLGTAAVIALVAGLAAWAPIRRATHLDPSRSLAAE